MKFSNKQEILAQIGKSGVVPVIRADSHDEARIIVEAILEGGINVLEITLTIPNAVALIEKLANDFQNDAIIGAGTVLDVKAVRNCFNAGAKFVVSPLFDAETVEFCRARQVVVMPRAMTITEIYRAWQVGADAVKIFPASALGGASFLKAVRTVFPEVKLMPTGGVTLKTAADFLQAGAFAVGIGGELVNLKAVRGGQASLLTETARKLTEIVKITENMKL
ncbi:MAG: bifunctional 4-hydroxy-2-oxoglutarate aldolase/2-dehydro-3-deoxy-phosphogluconate aldolase [Acidobacteriota bacterium]